MYKVGNKLSHNHHNMHLLYRHDIVFSLYIRRQSNCQPMRQAANENGTGNENTQPTPEADRVVEVGEDSNSSTGPATAATAATKISKEQPKTAAAIRKTQKAKQKENIEQKMLALLSEDRDKEDDEIELAFASIAKRAKVELDQKAKYKFIDAVNGLYAKFSSGEALAPPPPPPPPKPTQLPEQYLFAGGVMPSHPGVPVPVPVSVSNTQPLNELSFANM